MKIITPSRVSLTIIILLGAFLRFYQLSESPAGFFCDEASVGYNAYSLLTTGRDEHGHSWPIFFQAFGEYKSPIQTYSALPLIAIFGLSEFSVRLTSVLYGLAGIMAIYLLINQALLKTIRSCLPALFGAFFLAISPWHIHYSRTSLEGLTALIFLITLAVYLFLRARVQIKYLPISLAVFGLALYSYFPVRIFLPPFLVSLGLIYWRLLFKQWRQFFLGLAALLLISAPLALFTLSPVGLARWQQINIFTNPPDNQSVTQHIISNYLSHFSADFLFFKGDIGMPGQFITRHSIAGFGELYPWQIPLIIFGVLWLVRHRSWDILLIIIAWLALYPAGSMFSTDKSVQATRSIIGVVPWQILSALGTAFILEITRRQFVRRVLIVSLIIIALSSTLSYSLNYFKIYPLYSSDYWGWQLGPRESMKYFLTVKDNFDDLYLSGEFNASYIFLKFYDPRNSCADKCRLGNLNEPDIYNPDRHQLYSLSPDLLNKSSLQQNFQTHRIIYYPDGKIAFRIGEVAKKQ